MLDLVVGRGKVIKTSGGWVSTDIIPPSLNSPYTIGLWIYLNYQDK